MDKDGPGVEPSKLVLGQSPGKGDANRTGTGLEKAKGTKSSSSKPDSKATSSSPPKHTTASRRLQYRSIHHYIQTQGLDIDLPPVASSTTRPSPIIKIPTPPPPPSAKKQSYILQRIAMQQDCVDDDTNDTDT